MSESQKNSDTKIVSHAKVGIIGGGIMGVSLLYHLAKEGWKDLVLFEKGELTSGSTWHAAGQCPHFVGSYNSAKIHNYSNKLYQELEKETGLSLRPMYAYTRIYLGGSDLKKHTDKGILSK